MKLAPPHNPRNSYIHGYCRAEHQTYAGNKKELTAIHRKFQPVHYRKTYCNSRKHTISRHLYIFVEKCYFTDHLVHG